MKAEKVYYSSTAYELGCIFLAATDEGICYIGSPNAPLSDLENWLGRHFSSYELVRDEETMATYSKQIGEYFAGECQAFSVPSDLRGTEFQRQVWNVLMKIPYGKVITYSDVAVQMGKPSAVRAVASAIGANPVMILVPCHRVIAKSGKLAGFRGGLEMKKHLLELERI